MRTAPDGTGIKVEKGERFTIPAGFIQISLDPASRGKLSRPGLSFLLRQFFVGNYPKEPKNFVSFAKSVNDEADAILKSSERLKGLDLDKEGDAKTAIEKLKENQQSRDWHAMTMGAFCQSVTEAINKQDALSSAWSGYMLGTARGLTIVTEPLFEQTLWRGYLANQVVYEAAAAASQTPGEAEAIKRLEPLFGKLDEATLHTWVESKLPIGPRIGVKGLPEEILSALAKWHLASFQREREQTLRNASERRAEWELRLKWMTFGLAVAGAIFSGLKLVGLA
ncbi:MAG: hypothetical protein IPH23_08330 [Gammaproteobacteria bacterium]|nr:hypothetical protein [Gammaproteobacteria bacterium]